MNNQAVPNANQENVHRRRNSDEFVCNRRHLFKQLQDNSTTIEELVVLCNDTERIGRLRVKHPEKIPDNAELTSDDIRKMQHDRKAFKEWKFILLAGGLFLDNHLWLTQYQPSFQFDGELQAEFFNELRSMTASYSLPVEFYRSPLCVLDWLLGFMNNTSDCPPNLLRFHVLNQQVIIEVMDALCFSNQLIQKGGKYVVDRPSTIDMILDAEHRAREHRGAVETLYHPIHGTANQRFEAYLRIRPILHQLKNRKTDIDEYLRLDMAWQVALVSDNELQAQTMDLVTANMHKSLQFIRAIHERKLLYPFFEPDADFAFKKFGDWWKRLRKWNTEQVERVCLLLKNRDSNPNQLQNVFENMNQETLNNIKAVSNCLERHRLSKAPSFQGSVRDVQVHYPGIKSLIGTNAD